jgi:hypothetical protein
MSLQTFFKEKDFDIRTYEVEANGTSHIITTDVVIAAIHRSSGREREQIIATLQQLDFRNGDFHHYFKHLATGLAHQY